MPKNYKENAEEKSGFLSLAESDGPENKRGERDNTSPLRWARCIPIDRIKPDPGQPRTIFRKETLASLAASIKELGEIIDPLTVAYDEDEDVFRIISGERRYRAAKKVGLERLPCIIKEVDEQKKSLLQITANLQREDLTPLEESAAIKSIIENFGYAQSDVATLLNKSESYISQILGLDRLGQPARDIIQTSEVAKEIQIRASREKNPQKQHEIVKKASEEGKTVREIRAEGNRALTPHSETTGEGVRRFRKWKWSPEDERFTVVIHFAEEKKETKKMQAVTAALEETQKYINELACRKQ